MYREVNCMVTPNSKELKLPENSLLVSKTNTKGVITYCNDTFMEVTGYYEEELLGQSHHIIRHPDMPQSFYLLMQRRLKQGDEFLGFIKHLTKNGNYFWSFATITPSFDIDSQVIGYFSASRCPASSGVSYFEALYQRMVDEESSNTDQLGVETALQILNDDVQDKGGYNEFICSFYR
ncbi:hypothetical protein A9Q78_04855 [Methylophaga sp. 41_12_T18]|nr:hypothetical protein A9Q78_04855 [Methylophaga sp. 41_12_T18]